MPSQGLKHWLWHQKAARSLLLKHAGGSRTPGGRSLLREAPPQQPYAAEAPPQQQYAEAPPQQPYAAEAPPQQQYATEALPQQPYATAQPVYGQPQPVYSQPAPVAMPPAAPQTVQVQVPAGMMPGSVFNVQANGQMIPVTVPVGCKPGGLLTACKCRRARWRSSSRSYSSRARPSSYSKSPGGLHRAARPTGGVWLWAVLRADHDPHRDWLLVPCVCCCPCDQRYGGRERRRICPAAPSKSCCWHRSCHVVTLLAIADNK